MSEENLNSSEKRLSPMGRRTYRSSDRTSKEYSRSNSKVKLKPSKVNHSPIVQNGHDNVHERTSQFNSSSESKLRSNDVNQIVYHQNYQDYQGNNRACESDGDAVDTSNFGLIRNGAATQSLHSDKNQIEQLYEYTGDNEGPVTTKSHYQIEQRTNKNCQIFQDELLTDEYDDEVPNERKTAFKSICLQLVRYKNELQIKYILYAILVIVAWFVYGILNTSNVSTNKDDISMNYLRRKFPMQSNETWISIETIIDDILTVEPTRPAVFLLLYSGDVDVMQEIVHELATYAANKLETNQEYINVDENEFHREETISDYGYLLEKYKPEITEKQVMVVKDIQKIPAYSARAFHSFCDEITPLVDRAIYLLTLKVNTLDGKEEYLAESALKDVWGELHIDILMPLITRVTGTVLKISSDV